MFQIHALIRTAIAQKRRVLIANQTKIQFCKIMIYHFLLAETSSPAHRTLRKDTSSMPPRRFGLLQNR
jgi:hypothetical protein